MSRAPVHISETIRIARPAASVWSVIADYSRDAEWRAGIIEMAPDPPGLPRDGTEVHEVLRAAGRVYVADTTVSEVNDGVSYRFAGTGTSGDVKGQRLVRPIERAEHLHLRDRPGAARCYPPAPSGHCLGHALVDARGP